MRRRGWHDDKEGNDTTQAERLALLVSFLFIFILLHVCRHTPKEGLAFLGEYISILLPSLCDELRNGLFEVLRS